MSIIDTAKDIYDLLGKGANVELQEQLMKLRTEALAVQEENVTLRERVMELEAVAAQSDEMEFERGVYWREGSQGRDGPFCQKCLDVDKKTVRLQDWERTGASGRTASWKCMNCKAIYDA